MYLAGKRIIVFIFSIDLQPIYILENADKITIPLGSNSITLVYNNLNLK